MPTPTTNWTALACWLYENGSPDLDKLRRYKIATVYLDPRSLNAAQAISELRAAGIVAGIYEAPVWYGAPPSPSQFVGNVSRHANTLIPRVGTAEAPPLMLDLEAVSKDWIAQAVSLYRKFQPRRPTAITTEPFQDGTVIPIPELQAASMHWYPQCYRGSMAPVDTAAVVLEPCRWGFDPTRVHPFYDGARLPAEVRDGAVFTLERLP